MTDPAERRYQFVTDWHIQAPIEEVWRTILDSRRWPEWWEGVRRVEELEPGQPDGTGVLRRYTFRSALPYDLVFDMRSTRVEPPTFLQGEATGELEGTGRWLLQRRGQGTAVRYLWQVDTEKPWMNVLAPLLRPLFVWNHDYVMREGERGLRRLLEGRGL